MIASEIKDLWGIYSSRQHLDPDDLTAAIQDQVLSGDLDYRTRLLIRESLEALRAYWGESRFRHWLTMNSARERLEAICHERFDDDTGFPSLRRRVMEVTKPETIRAYLREIGQSLRKPLRIEVGGSIACILMGYLSRKTEDVDIVNEVPQEIRSQYQLLDELHQRYNLEMGHMQSHYLPSGWQHRLHSQAPFGALQVYLVDVYDVFLGKLTSIRPKDKDDLETLSRQLDKDVVVDRLKNTMESTFASTELREHAEKNWYILFGESLPT